MFTPETLTVLHAIGRVAFGAYFLYNGVHHLTNLAGASAYARSKGVPLPMTSVAVSGFLIILGGVGLIFDLYVQWALIAIILFLVPVTLMMHAFWKDQDPMARMQNEIQFGKNMALIAAALLLL